MGLTLSKRFGLNDASFTPAGAIADMARFSSSARRSMIRRLEKLSSGDGATDACVQRNAGAMLRQIEQGHPDWVPSGSRFGAGGEGTSTKRDSGCIGRQMLRPEAHVRLDPLPEDARATAAAARRERTSRKLPEATRRPLSDLLDDLIHELEAAVHGGARDTRDLDKAVRRKISGMRRRLVDEFSNHSEAIQDDWELRTAFKVAIRRLLQTTDTPQQTAHLLERLGVDYAFKRIGLSSDYLVASFGPGAKDRRFARTYAGKRVPTSPLPQTVFFRRCRRTSTYNDILDGGFRPTTNDGHGDGVFFSSAMKNANTDYEMYYGDYVIRVLLDRDKTRFMDLTTPEGSACWEWFRDRPQVANLTNARKKMAFVQHFGIDVLAFWDMGEREFLLVDPERIQAVFDHDGNRSDAYGWRLDEGLSRPLKSLAADPPVFGRS